MAGLGIANCPSGLEKDIPPLREAPSPYTRVAVAQAAAAWADISFPYPKDTSTASPKVP